MSNAVNISRQKRIPPRIMQETTPNEKVDSKSNTGAYRWLDKCWITRPKRKEAIVQLDSGQMGAHGVSLVGDGQYC